MSRLFGKTALITGSTSGIGRAIAAAFAAEGAEVVVSGRDKARGDETVAAITAAGGRAHFVAADLAGPPAAARHLAGAALAALGGRLDILVNNAGIFPSSPTADVDEATFEQVVAVNLRAPFFLTQALLPALTEARSSVINIGSWVATVGLGPGALYSGSKAMLEQFTRSWAAELGPAGIRFNSLAPGVTRTEGTAAHEEYLTIMAADFPARRVGEPAEIAAAAVFLAGAESAYMHGATLVVDGGALATR